MNLKKILFFSKNDGETLNEKLDLILDKQTQIEEGISNKIDKVNLNIVTQLERLGDTLEGINKNTNDSFKNILKELEFLNQILTKNLEKNSELEKTCEKLIESQKILVSDCKEVLKIQEEIFKKDDEILKKMDKTLDTHKKIGEVIEKLFIKQKNIITQCDILIK